MGIVKISLYEWCTTRVHHEEHDAERVPVRDLRLVGAASLQLGRHILHRAYKSIAEAHARLALDRAREAEICDFDVIVLIEQDVLKFEVPVRDAPTVHVADTLDHLLGVILDDGQGQTTFTDEVVEELALGQKLRGDIANFNLFLAVSESCVNGCINLLNYVLMLKLRVLESFVAEHVKIIGENFKGNLGLIKSACSFSDFTSASFTEHFTDFIIVDHLSIALNFFINSLLI